MLRQIMQATVSGVCWYAQQSLSRQQKSSGAFHVHCCMAQRAGARAWRCRVQAALMLSAAPEYAGNSLRSVLECCSVAEPTAEIVRSISCPLQHGPTCGRQGLALPGAGGSDAQCCARICRLSLRSVLVCCAVAEQTAQIVRSILCPLQHAPVCKREGMALPGAGGSDAQCCARLCRQQSQECAGMPSSR